ncbi:class I SAM-dependent methyltransferase [archaeon]|nr:MAG: class I SAM-dependent methyltransferase [archaeon]
MYKEIYNEDYFNGKNSFFYKFGYKDTPLIWNFMRNEIEKACIGRKRILDIGCAYGYFLQALGNRFDKYGADVSEHAIRTARRNSGSGKFVLCDAENGLPFGKGYFDIVTMFDVTEHIISPDALIKNAKAVLKKSGLLLISTPNNNLLRKTIFKIPDKLEHHCSLLSKEQITDILGNNGFKIIGFHTAFVFMNRYYKSESGILPQMTLLARKT